MNERQINPDCLAQELEGRSLELFQRKVVPTGLKNLTFKPIQKVGSALTAAENEEEKLAPSLDRNKKRKARNGEWLPEEHQAFLNSIHKHGNQWDKICEDIGTRNSVQVRSHSQKYFNTMRAKAIKLYKTDPKAKKKIFIVTHEYRCTTKIAKVEIDLPEELLALRKKYKKRAQEIPEIKTPCTDPKLSEEIVNNIVIPVAQYPFGWNPMPRFGWFLAGHTSI